jgi:predicted RNA-binding Zn-ribbon protein involved in translation (DUF1610 family)
MYAPVQTCNHCGATLSLDDLRRADCPYCGTVYPHRAQAEQHAQVVGQMMGQMMGQALQMQSQMRADVATQLPGLVASSFTAGSAGAPQVHVVHVAPGSAAGNTPPYASPLMMQTQLANHAQEAASRARTTVLVFVALSVLLVVGAAAAALLVLL